MLIFKNLKFQILEKDIKDIDYIKDVYKKRIQSEADSFLEQDEKTDTIFAHDILYLDKISI